MRNRFARGVILALATALVVPAIASAAVVTITPDNNQGWFIGTVPPQVAAPFQFVVGPGTPPAGIGSLATQITVPNQKLQIAPSTPNYNGTPLASFTALSYSMYRDATSPDPSDTFYANLYVDTTGVGNSHNVRLDFAPPSAAVGWNTFDILSDAFVYPNTGGGPMTMAQFLALNPNARLAPNPFGFPIPALIFNMGDTAANYVGFVGAFDNVTIGLEGQREATNFDFEPFVVPEPATMVLWSVLCLGGLGYGYRRWRGRVVPS